MVENTNQVRAEYENQNEALQTQGGEDYVQELSVLEKRSAVYRFIIGVEGAIAVVFLVGVFAMVMLQVFTRYVLNAPLSWTEEIARLLMVWLTFVSAMFVAGRREHLVVDVFVAVLPTSWARACFFFATVLSAVASAILAVGGITLTALVSRLRLPASSLPEGILYSAAIIGFAVIFVHSVINLVDFFKNPDVSALNEINPEKSGGV